MASFISSLAALDANALKRAFVLALSSWLSFVIASLLGIEHAYWAAMPVWVVAQATRGLVFERALYRLLGTAAGAILGIVILQWSPTVWQPLWMTLGVVCSIGFLHALSGVPLPWSLCRLYCIRSKALSWLGHVFNVR